MILFLFITQMCGTAITRSGNATRHSKITTAGNIIDKLVYPTFMFEGPQKQLLVLHISAQLQRHDNTLRYCWI